jgi:hypothetical protein
LVDGFLKGEVVGSTLVHTWAHTYHISAEGQLTPVSPCRPRRETYEPGIFSVWLNLGSNGFLSIYVRAPNKSDVHVCVHLNGNRKVVFHVNPHTEKDLEAMAFVQAILTWGWGSRFREDHPHLEISIHSNCERPCPPGFTHNALQAHVLPLLPFLSQHSKWWVYFWGCMHGPKRIGDRSP